MKRASCEKSGITKSPSISFRPVGRKKGRGVVCRGGGVMWRAVGWNRLQWPEEASQFSSYQFTKPERATTNAESLSGISGAPLSRRFEQTAFSKHQPQTYGNPNHQPAKD